MLELETIGDHRLMQGGGILYRSCQFRRYLLPRLVIYTNIVILLLVISALFLKRRGVTGGVSLAKKRYLVGGSRVLNC